MLRRQGHVSNWHDRSIDAGSDWAGEIDSHLRSAHIVLLLISSDFLASNYCYDVEATLALERHSRGEAVVIPIILRPCDWSGAPFGHIQAIPRDAKPVSTWPNRDEAFLDIARKIRDVALRTAVRVVSPSGAATHPPEGPKAEQARVLDAALAKHVTVGRPTELVAVVRSENSSGLRALLEVEEDTELLSQDVKSQVFRMEFPLDYRGRPSPAHVSLTVDAPQFEPRSQTKVLRVPPVGDSDTCRFLLVPKQAGLLRVMLEASVQDVYHTARMLRTSAESEPVANPAPMWIASIPLFAASAVVAPAAMSVSSRQTLPEATAPDAPGAPALPAPRWRAPLLGTASGILAVAVAIGLFLRQPPPDPIQAGIDPINASQLELGDRSYEVAEATPLASVNLSLKSAAFTKFARRVGGVALAAEATGKDGLAVIGLSYQSEAPDGLRLKVAVRDRSGQEHSLTAPIFDWQLVPLVRFVQQGGDAAVTLFGNLMDRERQERETAAGNMIANYHPALQDTLLGMRLLQADMLIIERGAADLFKVKGQYVLGKGEQLPMPSDVSKNADRFDRLRAWLQRQDEIWQSYVVGDVNAEIEFSIAGTSLVIAGDPIWYCWGLDEARIQELITTSLNSLSPDAFILYAFLDMDGSADGLDRFVAAVLKRPDMITRDTARPRLVPDSTLSRIRRLPSAKQGPELTKVVKSNLALLIASNASFEDSLLKEIRTATIAARREIDQLPAIQMEAYSRKLSEAIKAESGINPTVYASLQTSVRYSAFLRHVKRTNPELLASFAAKLSSVRPSVVSPPNYQVRTPTIYPRDNAPQLRSKQK